MLNDYKFKETSLKYFICDKDEFPLLIYLKIGKIDNIHDYTSILWKLNDTIFKNLIDDINNFKCNNHIKTNKIVDFNNTNKSLLLESLVKLSEYESFKKRLDKEHKRILSYINIGFSAYFDFISELKNINEVINWLNLLIQNEMNPTGEERIIFEHFCEETGLDVEDEINRWVFDFDYKYKFSSKSITNLILNWYLNRYDIKYACKLIKPKRKNEKKF